jgi:hypothetical protein
MMTQQDNLDEKPITNAAAPLDTMWDIDEGNFDDLITTNPNQEKDPVLGGLEIASESDDLLGLNDDSKKGSDLDLDKEEKEPAKEEEEDPELDIENFDASEPKEEGEEEEEEETSKVLKEGEENEFSVFAKMLAEKELLDINEDEFEATEEGLMDAFAGTIESRVKEELDLFQKGLPNEGKDLLRHLISGGRVSDFVDAYSAPDVMSLEVRGDSNTAVSNQRAVLKEFLKLRGDNRNEIEETVQDYEDLGKLEKQAAKAQERLAHYYESQKQNLASQQQQINTQREARRKEVINNIQDKVSNSVEIRGFPLSRKVKKDLLSYMTETTSKVDGQNGPQYVTKFQADEMTASQDVDDFILRAYLRMTNFNLDGVKQKSKSDLSSKLRDQLQHSKNRTGTQATFGGNKKPDGKLSENSMWSEL